MSSLSAAQLYTESKIRAGYSSVDIQIWQALCRQCLTEVGKSVAYMRTILDMADHVNADVLDIVSSGRQLSGQKSVNEKFIVALYNMVNDDGEGTEDITPSSKVLDLTCDEELSRSSGSYEETSEPGEGSRLYSKECYEIDGFVVEDHDSDEDVDRDDKVAPAKSPPVEVRVSGLARSNALVSRKRLQKRKLKVIDEEAEEE